MKLENTQIAGKTQLGKSTLAHCEDAAPTMDSLTCSMFGEDPHDGFADKWERHAVTMGHTKRLICDDLGDVDFAASPGFIERSKAENPRRRERENRDTAFHLMDVLASQRTDLKIHDRPMIRRFTLSPGLLWLRQHEPLPLSYLPYGLKPKSKQYAELIKGCYDPKVVEVIREQEGLSPTRIMETSGAAARLIDETWEDDAFQMRMEPSFELENFVQEKGVFTIRGGGANATTIRIMMRLLNLRLIRLVKAHWHRTRTKLPIKIYIDEAANYGLIGEYEASALAETSKMGLTWTIITQVPVYTDEIVSEKVSQCIRRKIWFGSAYPTSKFAAEDLKGLLDPLKEKYRETMTKQRHAGMSEVERVSKKIDGDGNRDGQVINTASVPIYEDVTEERIHYTPLNEQQLMTEADIQRLGVGECIINADGNIFRHAFRDWQDPGVFPGYSDKKLTTHIENLKKWGVLKPPVDYEPTPCTPQKTTEPKSKPKSKPAPSRKEGNAMD